jgi:hypothetical protein
MVPHDPLGRIPRADAKLLRPAFLIGIFHLAFGQFAARSPPDAQHPNEIAFNRKWNTINVRPSTK